MNNIYKTDESKYRSSGYNLALTFIHWLLAVILSIISYMLQYACLIDTGEDHYSFIFSGDIYRVNRIAYVIGIAVFLAGFCFLWKRYLAPDWRYFAGRCWGWKFGYIVITVVALAAVFVSGIVILFMKLGLSDNIRPEWTTNAFGAFPLYMVFIIIVDTLENIIRKWRNRNE